MKKMQTVFKKDPNDLSRVINEVQEQWVLDGEGVATRKWDGTACMVLNGELYKRYDCKRGKTPPEGAIPCQEPDLITGHWPHWVKCDRDNPANKYIWEAYDWATACFGDVPDGTYEACGPKINGNKQDFSTHLLAKHYDPDTFDFELTFESIRDFLADFDGEGIVFHHPDGRMAKIRRSDFGFKW